MLLASVLGYATPLDREQAELRARAFLSASYEGSAQRRSIMKLSSTSFSYLAKSEACYVFGLASGEGFVVAAADDRLPAVLGYSESALPSDATMPQNMRSWLLTYDKELEWLNEHGQPTLLAETATESEKVRRLIKPMIDTSWGQNTPYNNKVPKEGCPSGCVATAMAQIMYYHQWPQQATTAIPKYYMVSSPLEPVVFDWASMLSSYAGNYSTQSGDAVATLMRYAGQAVSMNYTKDGSGAYSEAVAYALATYFDYDAGMRFVQQAQYTTKEWEDLIYNELSQGRPVFYAGVDAWEGGHAFVCDGYSHDGYFHFNWGWDGIYDGYFLLSSMSPMFLYNFGYNHNAVIGIQPDKSGMDAESGGMHIFFTGANEWRQYPVWPATSAKDYQIYLRKDGKLSTSAPAKEEAFTEYISDPKHPVPYVAVGTHGRQKEYMTADQRFASTRQDVLTFRTDVLDEDLTLGGEIHINLNVSISTTDADFIVKVIDEFPADFRYDEATYMENNRAMLRDKGVLMGSYQMLVRGETMRGRYRNSFEHPEAFQPNEITKVSFDIPDIAHCFKKGHRLMIQIQSTWFPLTDINPQQFVNIYKCDEADFIKSNIRIYHDEQHPSSITFQKLDN